MLSLKSDLHFKKKGHRMKTRGREALNHPDLLSSSNSDKSDRAAVLDDRLSRCTEPSQIQPANSKVLWRKCSTTPHIMAHKYSWECWRPQQGESVWCEKVEKVHLKLISLSVSPSCGGWMDITMLVPSDCMTSHPLTPTVTLHSICFWTRNRFTGV